MRVFNESFDSIKPLPLSSSFHHHDHPNNLVRFLLNQIYLLSHAWYTQIYWSSATHAGRSDFCFISYTVLLLRPLPTCPGYYTEKPESCSTDASELGPFISLFTCTIAERIPRMFFPLSSLLLKVGQSKRIHHSAGISALANPNLSAANAEDTLSRNLTGY